METRLKKAKVTLRSIVTITLIGLFVALIVGSWIYAFWPEEEKCKLNVYCGNSGVVQEVSCLENGNFVRELTINTGLSKEDYDAIQQR